MSPNLIAFSIAFLGIVRAGAAQVNVNPLYTARELEFQLNDAGVNIIVVFSGVSATVAEVQDETQNRHYRQPWRRHDGKTAGFSSRSSAGRCDCVRGRAE